MVIAQLTHDTPETLKVELDERLSNLRSDILNIHLELVVMASNGHTAGTRLALARVDDDSHDFDAQEERSVKRTTFISHIYQSLHHGVRLAPALYGGLT